VGLVALSVGGTGGAWPLLSSVRAQRKLERSLPASWEERSVDLGLYEWADRYDTEKPVV
jgi:hypothetical protein